LDSVIAHQLTHSARAAIATLNAIKQTAAAIPTTPVNAASMKQVVVTIVAAGAICGWRQFRLRRMQ
jgi:hypothetical protein